MIWIAAVGWDCSLPPWPGHDFAPRTLAIGTLIGNPYLDVCLTGDTLYGWTKSVFAICATTGERSWIGLPAERP